MNRPSPLSEYEQAELVAYLDGELTGDAARAVETRMTLDPDVRAEAEALKRAWELLDFLPSPEPSPNFTHRTIAKLTPVQTSSPMALAILRRNGRLVFGACWLAALVVSAVIGYQVFKVLSPQESEEAKLIRELRLIENKRSYDLIDDVDFLHQLDKPDLFGEKSAEP